MYIGDIYLPILSNIDKKSVSKITKEIAGINAKEPRTVSIRRNLQPITLEGYLYNDGEKDDAQYAEDVEALQYRSAGYCYTKYADLDGFIEIENAEAPQTSEELGVRNYSVEGKYLPASKYERVVEVETEMRENEFNIEFPPHVALPVGATNVRVKTSQDSVKLTAPAFMAGDIPIYRPFPAFYPSDVTHSDSDAPQYDATAYKLTYNLLDAEDESISYTMVSGIDIPLGSYRVVLRIKEDSVVTGDVKITVSDGTTNVVDSLHTLVGDGVWNIVKTASFSILQRGLTYTITVTKAEDDATNIAVNYGFLLPEKRARVAFDVAAEYDVGECKVFDTITTDSEESTWIQVFNPEHDFAGDIVVQNSMFRWVIKQTAWKDATKVYNISGSAPVEIGKLYNKAFGDDSVAIKFKEIKPNYLKFTFELDTGNATSESTSAKEIDTVEITPFNVVIDKDVIGTYKDHYTFESTPIEMIEYENGVIAGIDSNSVYGLIKSVNVTSSYDGDIIETTGSESSDSYVVPFVIPCEITSYLYKQAADLVISKDNGDVERKFWKDDFSVDSSSQYTGDVGSFTWDTENRRLTCNVSTSDSWSIVPKGSHTYNTDCIVRAVVYVPTAWDRNYTVAIKGTGVDARLEFRDNADVYMYYLMTGSKYKRTNTPMSIVRDAYNLFEFVISKTNVTFYCNGAFVALGSGTAGYEHVPFGTLSNISVIGRSDGSTGTSTVDISEIAVLPSESYADDFAIDTTERYQAVTGTVAYDDTNKRMNVTTAAGANGKASGRLKSYKFCEGAQQFDVTLPVGADGDFICMVTHATDPAMTNGIGVGLQSDGAGNWNLATLSGTTVTVGAPSGLTDGKTARIVIEKDNTGAYWYYIYDAAGAKPTVATGKLFTTLSEGYTGWYAKGNSKTYAIDNISIRAESIVGRTNVEVTESFWFRDEFGEDSRRRYIIKSSGSMSSSHYKIEDGYFKITRPGASMSGWMYYPTRLRPTRISGMVKRESTKEYTSDPLIFFNISGTWYGADNRSPAYGYGLRVSSTSITLLKYDSSNGYGVVIGTYMTTVPTDIDFEYEISITDGMISVKWDTVENVIEVNDSTYTDGYVGLACWSNSAYCDFAAFNHIEISGTRVYQKPIHRGAMLGLYSTS